MLKNIRKKAYTLVELLLVLGVMMTGGIVVYSTYQYVDRNIRINQTIDLASLIIKKVDDVSTFTSDYSNFGTFLSGYGNNWQASPPLTPELLTSGIIPSYAISAAPEVPNYLINPMKSQPPIGVFYMTSTNMMMLKITVADPDACIKIAGSLVNQADAMIISYSGNGAYMSFASMPKTWAGVYDRSLMESYCLQTDYPSTHIHVIKLKH